MYGSTLKNVSQFVGNPQSGGGGNQQVNSGGQPGPTTPLRQNNPQQFSAQVPSYQPNAQPNREAAQQGAGQAAVTQGQANPQFIQQRIAQNSGQNGVAPTQLAQQQQQQAGQNQQMMNPWQHQQMQMQHNANLLGVMQNNPWFQNRFRQFNAGGASPGGPMAYPGGNQGGVPQQNSGGMPQNAGQMPLQGQNPGTWAGQGGPTAQTLNYNI